MHRSARVGAIILVAVTVGGLAFAGYDAATSNRAETHSVRLQPFGKYCDLTVSVAATAAEELARVLDRDASRLMADAFMACALAALVALGGVCASGFSAQLVRGRIHRHPMRGPPLILGW